MSEPPRSRPNTKPPLRGLRVVVTRAAHQADELAERFALAGADVVRLPLLALAPPADPAPLVAAGRDIARYDGLVFTSANAVDAFLPRLDVSSSPASPAIATVGPKTSAAVREHGFVVTLEAEKRDAAGLLAALRPRLAPGARLLLPQAADARPELAADLRQAGLDVTTVVAYDKRLPPETIAAAELLFAAGPLGWTTFTSPRIVRHFRDLLGDAWPRRRSELAAISIGRVTSEALRHAGVEPAAEAATPDAATMVEATIAAVERRSAG